MFRIEEITQQTIQLFRRYLFPSKDNPRSDHFRVSLSILAVLLDIRGEFGGPITGLIDLKSFIPYISRFSKEVSIGYNLKRFWIEKMTK